MSLRRVKRLPGRSALTMVLCFTLAVAPVTASAEPTGVRAIAAACMLYFAQLAGAQPPEAPKAANPAEVRKAEDVAKEIEKVRQAEIEAKKKELEDKQRAEAEAAKGSGWGVIAENFGKPFEMRTEVYLAMAAAGGLLGAGMLVGGLLRVNGTKAKLMAKRKDIRAAEKEALDGAVAELEAAEKGYYEAIEREAVGDQTARAALLERATQMTSAAKDRLIAVLQAAERRAGTDGTADTRPASVPEGPSSEAALEVLLAKYETMAEVYNRVRNRLLDTTLEAEVLPEMENALKLLEGLDDNVRRIGGLDRAIARSTTARDALKKLDETIEKFLDNQVSRSRRPYMALAAPAITIAWAVSPDYWPVYLAAGATSFALWGANVRARWRATILLSILTVVPTTGYLTHLYFKGQNAKVEQAQTAQGDRAIQDRPLGEWPTMRYRDQEYLAQGFADAWLKVPELEGVAPPIKPSGNPAAPNPLADAIQKTMNDAKADLTKKFGSEENARPHLEELYQLVARAFANQSKEFRDLTAAEQDAIVKFLAKQMVAHPHRIPQPPASR